MKYISIMRNLSVVLLTAFFVAFSSLGQNTTANSPYSSFGLGELGGLDHAVLSGIGNANIGLIDSTFINYYNPSSYGLLAQGQPLFNVGISSRLSTYSEGDVSNFSSVTAVQNFSLAFPFAKRFGLAFGLKPYTRRGYEFSERFEIEDDSLMYNYSGKGGINEVFLGFAANVLEYKGSRLSIGGNLGYLFGTVSNTRKSGLIEPGNLTYAGGVGIKTLRANAVHYEVGAHFTQTLSEKHTIGLSAVIDPLQNIGGTYEDGFYYANDVDNPLGYDTLTFNDSLTGAVTNVPKFTYGLSYSLLRRAGDGNNSRLNTSLSFQLNYSMIKWSQYENRFEDTTLGFLDGTNINFGIQYIPEALNFGNSSYVKYYHKMRYRIGAYYATLPYESFGEQVNDFGITFGIGLPIVIKNSISTVNFGFAYGNRGVSDNNALNEEYYGINVGLSIAPGADKWFRKRKLN